MSILNTVSPSFQLRVPVPSNPCENFAPQSGCAVFESSFPQLPNCDCRSSYVYRSIDMRNMLNCGRNQLHGLPKHLCNLLFLNQSLPQHLPSDKNICLGVIAIMAFMVECALLNAHRPHANWLREDPSPLCATSRLSLKIPSRCPSGCTTVQPQPHKLRTTPSTQNIA